MAIMKFSTNLELKMIGKIHAKLFYRNNDYDSLDSDNSIDVCQYVVPALRKTEIGSIDQLCIYFELGIYP